MLDAYYNAVGKVALWGNTQFHHFLSQVNSFVERHQQTSSQYKQTYTISLIITDGIINDMQETIDEIVRASHMPISIIIVGVGNANFDQMVQLDGDVTPLFSNKLQKYVERDIV